MRRCRLIEFLEIWQMSITGSDLNLNPLRLIRAEIQSRTVLKPANDLFPLLLSVTKGCDIV